MRTDTMNFPKGTAQEGIVTPKSYNFIRESRATYDTLKIKSKKMAHKKDTGTFGKCFIRSLRRLTFRFTFMKANYFGKK